MKCGPCEFGMRARAPTLPNYTKFFTQYLPLKSSLLMGHHPS